MYKLSHEFPKKVYVYYRPELGGFQLQEELKANLEGQLVGEYELKRTIRVKVEIKMEDQA